MIIFVQLIVASIVLFLFKIFTRFEVYGREHLRGALKPLLVTPNHKSMLDPFVVGAVLLFSKLSLGPFRFMTKDQLFLIPGLNILLWSLGSFRAHKKRGLEKSLKTPLRLLRSGESIIIFPEAHIVPGIDRLGEPRKGAAILALTTGAPILPVSFFTSQPLTLWNFLLRRPRVILRIGSPYHLGLANPHISEEKLHVATQKIMERISYLYFTDVRRSRA